MKTQGSLYIISAPSGGGKTSLVSALTEIDKNIYVSISHTTRAIRPGEINGKHYFFVNIEEFTNMIERNEFLEHANVFGNHYGTSKAFVDTHLQNGNDVILEIDWQGAQQMRNNNPEAISIFIIPPSQQILKKRLEKRAQDTQDTIAKRMDRAHLEIAHYTEYDYLIINDDFQTALKDLGAIVRAQRLTTSNQQMVNQDLIDALLE